MRSFDALRALPLCTHPPPAFYVCCTTTKSELLGGTWVGSLDSRATAAQSQARGGERLDLHTNHAARGNPHASLLENPEALSSR